MSIESLKKQARKHEQNEDWGKALDQYLKALSELAQDEQVDIGLYNRVGDLYVRVGKLDSAVEHYEQAVDLYREAYLPNNAIAVCKKIIRNVPERHRAYLVIGQIRAEQGFLPDARTNFLTYAERMQQAGDLDESFRALIEFCDLAPEDVGVRVTVAENMAASGRQEEAVTQLVIAYNHFVQVGDSGQAAEIESKVREIDPDADMTAVPAGSGFGSGVDDEGDIIATFGEIDVGRDAFESEDSEAGLAGLGAMEESAGDDDDDLPGFEFEPEEQEEGVDAAVSEGEDASEDEASELPMMSFDEDDDESSLPGADFEVDASDDEGGELPGFESEDDEVPTMDFDGGDPAADELSADDDPPVELPAIDFGTDGGEAEAAPELPTMDFDDDDAGDAPELPTMDFDDDEPEDATPLPTMDFGVESEGDDDAFDVASSIEDAAEDAASEPASFDEEVAEPIAQDEGPADGITASDIEIAPPPPEDPPAGPPAAAEEQAPAQEPPAPQAPDEGYVDLGAMILGGQGEKTTRFTVAYQEPSGDEDADFAKMLSQFKEKVSENLDSSDVRAHYDLGTAYKEMGLLDEAISSFQAALRASADHLPTYELMGQTFIEMGQPEAAVRSLERAIESANTVEDEMVGIYYYLGRAYEALQNRDSAVEFYDRVFALDINFADVTERLRELR